MTLLLNAILLVVLAISVIVSMSMSKVGKEAIASLPAAGVRNVGEEQVAAGHVMWSRLSFGLIALVVVGFVLVNI